ncbi:MULTISPECIES: aldehyde dehydrogenase family protein [unclassified Pseudomonas]|uniref:aldehyde dehydrogenase family protein n=1 Tax=unclassified Pseudomonas TaxID=196821 RepID=UPI000C87DF58|nr:MULTISPECIES: aldehyde dehydrogenase family protein [unclassified Pseudomonas]PMZ73225.1 hypothetical protein C1X25_08765 [Pseudomonas sp. GW247-3R2A]PMY73355.1 hypothetical protein C1X26_11760 [Pseudomonas sp. MPR-R3A]PMY98035.1 hypothetical protein C1X24_11040 [Pseudomonas sp. FW305-124]PNA92623.1 hypothetical protein C1X23_13550 [Pseudomonas sp. FW300-E2]PNB03175.1 hypothetical protein C1X27_09220 [Pseudomonas sp. MPR-AND1B]
MPGDPLNPGNAAGAFVDSEQTGRIIKAVAEARIDGATLQSGGEQLSINGSSNFIQPTIFGDVTNGMRISRNEVFDPVLADNAFNTEEEAVQQANDSIYEMAALVWSNDLNRSHR